jgi:hypothetical protein
MSRALILVTLGVVLAAAVATGIAYPGGAAEPPADPSMEQRASDPPVSEARPVEATVAKPASLTLTLPDSLRLAERLVLDLTVSSKSASSARVLLKGAQAGDGSVEIGRFTVLPGMQGPPAPGGESDPATRIRLRLDAAALRTIAANPQATVELELVSPLAARSPNGAAEPGPTAAADALPPITITGARFVAR